MSTWIYTVVGSILLQWLPIGLTVPNLDHHVPRDGAVDVPLNDFSMLLTFSETVQQGWGGIVTVSVMGSAEIKTRVPCTANGRVPFFSGKDVVIPITSELSSNTTHSVEIPQQCFKSAASNIIMAGGRQFSFTTLPSSAHDVTGPVNLNVSLQQPVTNSWLQYTPDTVLEFSMFFTEAVQEGFGPVHFLQRIGVNDSFSVWGPPAELDFDESVQYSFRIPGKFTMRSQTYLQRGAQYALWYGSGALRDLAGNAIENMGTPTYLVQVSAELLTPVRLQPLRLMLQSVLLLEFKEPVRAGLSGGLKLCVEWTREDPCSQFLSVELADMIFLGSKVIVSLPSLTPSTQYNLSMGDTSIVYFSGIVATSDKQWEYSIYTENTSLVDSDGPALIIALVDCNGNGALGIRGVSDQCDADGDGIEEYYEQTGQVTEDTPMKLSARFKLFFDEKVMAVADKFAKLLAHDKDLEEEISPIVGDAPETSVVTLSPSSLRPGKLYTLTLPGNAITDLSGNAYSGSSMKFYTPAELVSITPEHGAANVIRSVAIVLKFAEAVMLGISKENRHAIIQQHTSNGVSTTRVDLSNPDVAMTQGNELVLIPFPQLHAGYLYSVTLPKHSIRFLTVDIQFSFTTRAEDHMKPRIIYSHPHSVKTREEIEALAPYVLFSEGVSLTPGKSINIKEDGNVQYSLDSASTTCGMSGDGCLEFSPGNRILTIYPRGKIAGGGPAPWAAIGKTYQVEFQDGAVTDALTTGSVLNNKLDASSFYFTTDADVVGPLLQESAPTECQSSTRICTEPRNNSRLSSANLDMTTVVLEFNEAVQAGNGSFSIQSWYETGAAPVLTNPGSMAISTHRPVVVLTFDTAVQAGEGSLALYENSSENQVGRQVPMTQVSFVGHRAMFSPGVDSLPSGVAYYVASSSATDAIRSSSGEGIGITRRETSALFVASDIDVDLLTWSLEDVLCGEVGELPNITLYMNMGVEGVNAGRTIALRFPDREGHPPILSLQADLYTTSGTMLAVNVDSTRDYVVHLHTADVGIKNSHPAALSLGSENSIVLDSGLILAIDPHDAEPEPESQAYVSSEIVLTWTVCESMFNAGAPNVVQLYSSFFSSSGARKFRVSIPSSAVMDSLGNMPSVDQFLVFSHESDGPKLDVLQSKPRTSGSSQENVVLSFNEVVQAGTGAFEIWNTLDASGPEFIIDIEKIASSSHDGHNLISGKTLSITPKTLCDFPQPCTDLKPGTTYYIKSNDRGVVRDIIGNRISPFTTEGGSKAIIPEGESWRFDIVSYDTKPPEIAFFGGYVIEQLPLTVVGYIYFSENIIQNGNANVLQFSDYYGATDISPFTDAAITFGTGSPSDGTSEYGMLMFNASLPVNDRRYKITVLSNGVEDASGNQGPLQPSNFLIDVGSTPMVEGFRSEGQSGLVSNSERPLIVSFDPEPGAKHVDASLEILLWFNEDVQLGTGVVHFCLNEDVLADNPSNCEPGSFVDGQNATFDIADAVVKHRTVTMNLNKKLAVGQQLFVVMPAGLILDSDAQTVGAIERSMYMFIVEEEDLVAPALVYVTPAISVTEKVVLMFTEAVQTISGQNIFAEQGGNSVELSVSITGNQAMLWTSWTAGMTYYLSTSGGNAAFVDLAGNHAAVNFTAIVVAISNDVQDPSFDLLPGGRHSTTTNRYDSLMLEFDEIVQKRSGVVRIEFSSQTSCYPPCSEPSLFTELAVATLPCVDVIIGSSKKTVVIIDPGAPFLPDVKYNITVPASSFVDMSNNPFRITQTFSLMGSMLADVDRPVVRAVYIGDQLPNPNFMEESIVLYFSEAVQLMPSIAGSHFVFKPSSGQSHCSDSESGTCNSNNCVKACNYEPASVEKQVADDQIVIHGATVTVTGLKLFFEDGKGYELAIDEGKFIDLAGLRSVAVHPGSDLVSSFRTSVQDFQGPVPLMDACVPPQGSRMVPPSTTISISFNEVVQQGSGEMRIIGERMGASAVVSNIAVGSCYFLGKEMTCKPDADLALDTKYSISFDSAFVTDSSRNNADSAAVSSFRYEFTTINIDYIAPALAAKGGESYAIRPGSGQPLDPPFEAENIAIGTTLALTFTEVVQAGSGQLVFSRCSAGTCQDVDSIDIQASNIPSKMIFDGASVYIHCWDFLPVTLNSIRTDAVGAFKDVVGNVFPMLQPGFDFSTLAEDHQPPVLVRRFPRDTDRMSGMVPVVLYFSEAVQAANNSQASVSLSANGNDLHISVNDEDPTIGYVLVQRNKVTIKAAHDFGNNTIVEVNVGNGIFMDLVGNEFTGISFQYKTASHDFEQVLGGLHHASPFPARAGALLHASSSGLLLLGGKSSGRCCNDSWTSIDGETWSPSEQNWTVANAPSAVDGSGCLYTLGGDCISHDGLPLWRSCDNGIVWTQFKHPIVVPTRDAIAWYYAYRRDGVSPQNTPEVLLPNAFPTDWTTDHAITIIGGWQLVILNAADHKDQAALGVWKFVDSNLTYVQRVARAPFPFGYRRSPNLVATSDNRLYLLGGYRCHTAVCANWTVFNDVWASEDFGETWKCQTADVSGIMETNSVRIGYGASVVVANDDTIYIFGGEKLSHLDGPSTLLRSHPARIDQVFSSIPILQTPTAYSFYRHSNYTLYFPEGLQITEAGYSSIKMIDLGADNSLGGFGDNEDQVVPIRIIVIRQMLTLDPVESLIADRRYRVEVPRGSLADSNGNLNEVTFQSHDEFRVHDDISHPIVQTVSPDDWTYDLRPKIILRMNEPVHPGAGAILLRALEGVNLTSHHVSFDISSATISDTIVTFSFPENDNRTRLLLNRTYEIVMPAGLLRDEKHNFVPYSILGEFVVLNSTMATTATSTSLISTTATVGSNVDLVLRGRQPQHEAAPTFELPSSVSILLTFSDQIQAGSGNVVLEPRFSSPTVIIPAEQLILNEQKVFISPPQGLMPGEIYTVRIDNKSFHDSHSNYFEGLQDSSYIISIAPSILFQDLTSTLNLGSFGVRVSSSAVVDSDSNIFIYGGRNHRGGSIFNEVWKLSTGGATTCASAFEERRTCSATNCSAPASGSDLPALGNIRRQRRVWRAATEGGISCMSSSGDMNTIGDIVQEVLEECSCPMCITQPSEPLPQNMIGNLSMDNYTYVSAFQGEREVLCASGYTADGDFTCTVQDIWTAEYQRPYPQCLPALCTEPATIQSGSKTVEILNASCINTSATSPVVHGHTCNFTCETGYYMADPIECKFGQLVGPTCAALPCEVPEVTFGTLFCPDSIDVAIPATGGTCQVACNPGYFPKDVAAYVTCSANASGGLSAPPIVRTFGALECAPSVCSVFEYLAHDWGTTFNPEIKEPVENNPSQPVVMQVYCHSGWRLSTEHSQLYCGPALNLPGASQAMWMLQAGRPAGPMCRRTGKEFKPRAIVDGSLVLGLSLSSSLTKSKACEILPGLLPAAIRKGLTAAGEIAGIAVTSEEISEVSVTECGRRLSLRRQIFGRRDLASNAQLSATATYKLTMIDGSHALSLAAALKAPSQTHALQEAVIAHFKQADQGIVVVSAENEQFQVQITQDEVSIPTSAPVLTTEPPPLEPAPFLRVNTRAPRSDEEANDGSGGAGIIAGAVILSILGAALLVLVFVTYKQKMSAKSED